MIRIYLSSYPGTHRFISCTWLISYAREGGGGAVSLNSSALSPDISVFLSVDNCSFTDCGSYTDAGGAIYVNTATQSIVSGSYFMSCHAVTGSPSRWRS
jgi:hypothetical protein